MWLTGWREWIVAWLCILDCWLSFRFHAFASLFDGLSGLCATYVIPVALTTHVLIDGLRWQLYPFYGQLCLTTASALFRPPGLTMVPLVKVAFAVLAFVACSAFSIPALPEPEGSWGCGVEEFQFTVSDWRRLDGGGSDKRPPKAGSRTSSARGAGRRTFQVLLFYPIESHRHQHESRYGWLPREAPRALAAVLGLPKFLFTYLQNVETHSMLVAPLSRKRKKYPIVFFSHGLTLLPTLHSVLCEGLASQGYIVVAIHHTDGSALLTQSQSGPHVSVPFYGSIGFPSFALRLPPESRRHPLRRLKRREDGSPPSSGHEADRQVRHDVDALTELIGKGPRTSRTTSNARAPITNATTHTTASSAALLSDLELRRAQALLRAAELRAAYEKVTQLSETSGSWIKGERVVLSMFS